MDEQNLKKMRGTAKGNGVIAMSWARRNQNDFGQLFQLDEITTSMDGGGADEADGGAKPSERGRR